MRTIGKFKLSNQGGFVAKLQFSYIDQDGERQHKDGTGSILLGQSETADPGDYGVPDGAMVALYVFVVWGTDNLANQMFTYKKGSPETADYTISGTTLSNHLGLTGVTS